ncbi:flavin reductase family protein [Aureimonas altamirensis]|uniref:flavin reductase family protein n=1 Tax=Aureimonas altamirensis TaxID=370622 RepID=UPI001E32C920|nr:flavin reductase family protein [Aureimonas altamirensis]UHD45970.1 flavin reductase family protein [Aureimonas altamirensis]
MDIPEHNQDDLSPNSLRLMPMVRRDVEEQQFKDAMSRLAFSIAVVTTQARHGPIGRTVTSFMPLSAVPAQIMISVHAESRLAGIISYLGTFSISFLASGQEEVGDAFAGKRPAAERFNIGQWRNWPSGNPKLLDAALCLDCSVVGFVESGEHLLFVGSIVGLEGSEDYRAMVWHERSYRPID